MAPHRKVDNTDHRDLATRAGGGRALPSGYFSATPLVRSPQLPRMAACRTELLAADAYGHPLPAITLHKTSVRVTFQRRRISAGAVFSRREMPFELRRRSEYRPT